MNTEQASLPTAPTSAQPSTHSSATERWAPGMMDTVLNVGLNDHSVLGLTDAEPSSDDDTAEQQAQ